MNTTALRLDDVDDLDMELDDDILNSFNEPEEGDYTTDDYAHFYQYGKLVYVVDADEPDTWQEQLRHEMDRQAFWPNVWVISDHGNSCLLDVWTD